MTKPYSVPFDIEDGSGGVRVIVTQEPLCPGCMSDGEVDSNINALIQKLERLRPKMKVAAKRLRDAPIFG